MFSMDVVVDWDTVPFRIHVVVVAADLVAAVAAFCKISNLEVS